MATQTTYNNAKVMVNDQNGSFVSNKTVRSVSVKWTPDENYFELTTPKPQEKRETIPPIFQKEDYGIALNKLTKGYKLGWDVNIKAAKIAGAKKIKAAICEGVDAMFKEIDDKNL